MNRVRYFCLLFIFISIFFVFQSFGILVIIGLLVLLPVASFLLCRYAEKRIEFEILTTGEILDKGQGFPVTLCVTNHSFIPVLDCQLEIYVRNGFMTAGQSYHFHISVPAGGNEKKVFPVSSKYCGRIEIRIIRARMYDFLHLFLREENVDAVKNVMIFPLGKEQGKIDTSVYISGEDEVEESQTKGSDFSEVSEIREYIPGDNLKDIHWKLSAKKEELMVKEHVSLSSKQYKIFVELLDGNMEKLDGILERAFSAGKQLLLKGQGFSYCWWSKRAGCMKEKNILSEEDLMECFQEIYYEKPYDEGAKYETEKR